MPAAPVQDLATVARHEQTRALGILQTLGGHETVAAPLTLDGERLLFPSPPPLLGEHSTEVLAEAGYSDQEVAELVAAGVVA